MNKKYELTADTIEFDGKVFSRIRALTDFGSFKEGKLGGYVEKEDNLSQYDNAYVGGNACVVDNAYVGNNAYVGDNAHVGGNACVVDNAYVGGNACVEGDACVGCDAHVGGDAYVGGNAYIGKDAYITKTTDYLTVGAIGSRTNTTTFYRTKTGANVTCGCFCGTLEEFEKAVKQTHGGTFYEKEYNVAMELAKVHFGLEESDARSEVEEQI